jgi:hypothetical protein
MYSRGRSITPDTKGRITVITAMATIIVTTITVIARQFNTGKAAQSPRAMPSRLGSAPPNQTS